MYVSRLVPNAYLVHASYNLSLHFAAVLLAPVQQKHTQCRGGNPTSPVSPRWPTDGQSTTVPSSASDTDHRLTCPTSAWGTRVSKDWQLFGNSTTTWPLLSSLWEPAGKAFLLYFSALEGAAGLPGASYDPAKATSERTGETWQASASAASR